MGHTIRVWGVLVCTLVAVKLIYFLNPLTELIPLMSIHSAELELSSINTSRLEHLHQKREKWSHPWLPGPRSGRFDLFPVVLIFPQQIVTEAEDRQPHCSVTRAHGMAKPRERHLSCSRSIKGKCRAQLCSSESRSEQQNIPCVFKKLSQSAPILNQNARTMAL